MATAYSHSQLIYTHLPWVDTRSSYPGIESWSGTGVERVVSMLSLEKAAAEKSKPTVACSSNSWLPVGVSISKRRHQNNAVNIGRYISMLGDLLSGNS